MIQKEDKNAIDVTKHRFNTTESQFRASYYFLGSHAWNKLTRIEQQLFFYILTALKYRKKHKRDRDMVCWNNGDIECSYLLIKEKIPMSSATMSKAVRNLIGVGLVRLTREGQNKQCHKYKLLYESIGVPQREQRWRDYPNKNWYSEAPKRPNNLVGKKSQWKKGVCGNPNFKTHPTKVNGIDDKRTTKVSLPNGNGLQNYID